MTYGASCKYLHDNQVLSVGKDSYEEKIIEVFEKKLFKLAANLSEEKKRLLKHIRPFLILPKMEKRD